MLREALELLAKLARDSAEPKTFKIPGVRSKVGVVVDGEHETWDREPFERGGELHTIDDVVAFASGGACTRPEVYVSPTGVLVLVSGDERHDIVSMPFVPSRPFSALLDLDNDEGRDFTAGPDLVRYLRFELGLGGHPILAALRRIDFNRSARSHAASEHTTGSLGRSVEMEVQGAAELPDFLEMDVVPFKNRGAEQTYRITVGIFLDLVNERIHLRPATDEVTRVMNLALEHVHTTLTEALTFDDGDSAGRETVPVYRGTPRS
jgi:hypothetical protein